MTSAGLVSSNRELLFSPPGQAVAAARELEEPERRQLERIARRDIKAGRRHLRKTRRLAEEVIEQDPRPAKLGYGPGQTVYAPVGPE